MDLLQQALMDPSRTISRGIDVPPLTGFPRDIVLSPNTGFPKQIVPPTNTGFPRQIIPPIQTGYPREGIPEIEDVLRKPTAFTPVREFEDYKIKPKLYPGEKVTDADEFDIWHKNKGVKVRANITDVSLDEGPDSILVNYMESHSKGAGREMMKALQRKFNKIFIDVDSKAGQKMAEELGFKQTIKPEESDYGFGSYEWIKPKGEARAEAAEEAIAKGEGKRAVTSTEMAPIDWYSKSAEAVKEKMGGTATPGQIEGMLKDMPKTEQEIFNLKEFLKGKMKVSKEELLQYLQENMPKVEVVVKNDNSMGNLDARIQELVDEGMNVERANEVAMDEIEAPDDGPESRLTKFSSYQLPGGSNYREVLIKAPDEGTTIALRAKKMFGKGLKDLTVSELEQVRDADQSIEKSNFKSSHWDEPNVLAHLRVNDRTTPDGKKVLFLEEMQSDWAREARATNKQYSLGEEIPQLGKVKEIKINDDKTKSYLVGTKWWNENKLFKTVSHPLLKNWQELALKQALKEAVEKGYDYISWTSGEQQADRYDLSKHYYSIEYLKRSDGTYALGAVTKKGNMSEEIGDRIKESELDKYVGKDIASKIKTNKGKLIKRADVWRSLSDLDLKIGGEWAKNLYDVMIPSFLNKLTKRFGGRVGEAKIKSPSNLPGKDYGQYVSKIGGKYYISTPNDLDPGPELREGQVIQFIKKDKIYSATVTNEFIGRDDEQVELDINESKAVEKSQKGALTQPVLFLTPSLKKEIRKKGLPISELPEGTSFGKFNRKRFA